ncbi:hypothetical protein [Brevundimonas sp. PAMC22021]|uniref:hypothetical protein n=1 Tax=Brevundimonas sp. PAMC22021 TaxID=2861285 RepID=UPI001C62EDEF|nr:hypothetical protein [Brevundimonas sp. PAMC22021]QYF85959.1 hypothetical protein KY493_08765 [Brevundimonas sp. PAMC22021]
MRKVIISSAVLAAAVAGLAAAPASAETLNVQTSIAPYCSVRLANVSSGATSVANTGEVEVANLQLACNNDGARLVVNPRSGDFVHTDGVFEHRINYSMRLDADINNFDIANSDTFPGDAEGQGLFTRDLAAYSQPLASGSNAKLWLNANVNNQDTTGLPASSRLYPANAAPSGTYTEVFEFTMSAI